MPPKPNVRSRRRRNEVTQSGDTRMLSTLNGILDATETAARGSKPSVPDVPRIRLRMKAYTFSRMSSGTTLSVTTGVPLATGLTFSIDQVPAYTDFTNFFDMYRILQVRVTLAPGTVSANTILYSAIDYDDSNVPITASDLLERETCEITSNGVFCHRTLVPCVPAEVYQSALTSGYAPKARQWLDCSNPSIPHNGLKLYSPTLPTGSPASTWLYVAEYIIQGKFAA